MTTTPTPIQPTATPDSTNVNVSTQPASHTSVWTGSRVTALAFTVIEVLLLVRFALKLFGANAEQPLASAIYGVTEPLVAAFRGIFAQPQGTPVVEIATLLSVVFFMLVGALVLAIVRAVTGKQSVSGQSA